MDVACKKCGRFKEKIGTKRIHRIRKGKLKFQGYIMRKLACRSRQT